LVDVPSNPAVEPVTADTEEMEVDPVSVQDEDNNEDKTADPEVEEDEAE
jgi:hypothetical protein